MRGFGSLVLLGALAASAAAAPPASPALETAAAHPMKYLLSLPRGWTPGRTWPVVVVIPDARRDFEGNLAAFVEARGARPFILVAPHVVTSGGANYRLAESYRYSDADWARVAASGDFRFDEDGIAAVLADVRRRAGGEEKVFLTGWEAGGHTVWALLFRHPEWFRAVAPVSTNWLGRWMGDGAYSASATRAALPVRVFFCDKAAAPAGWDFLRAQTKNAMDAAATHGFRDVTLATVPGRPHGPLADEVLAFFESVR